MLCPTGWQTFLLNSKMLEEWLFGLSSLLLLYMYLNMWTSNLKANSLYWQTCFSNHLPPLKTDKLNAGDSLLKRQVAIHVQASGYRCLQSTPGANLQYTQSQFAYHHRHAYVELVVYMYVSTANNTCIVECAGQALIVRIHNKKGKSPMAQRWHPNKLRIFTTYKMCNSADPLKQCAALPKLACNHILQSVNRLCQSYFSLVRMSLQMRLTWKKTSE